MFKTTDLPNTIPIFPLPGALLLPRGNLPLHIFEPRYLALVEDCLKTPDRFVGMIQPTARDELHKIGCAGRLTGFSETEDGRYMITLTGVSRYRILDEVEGFTPYRRARIDWAGFDRDTGPIETDPDFDRESFLALLSRFLSEKGLKTDWESLKTADDELLINSLSMLCPFDSEDKQALLEAPCLSTRREMIKTLFHLALSGTMDGPVQ